MIFRVVFTVPLALCLVSTTAAGSDVVDLAASLIGRPYVWGAEGPRAFDCSGLTQYVFGEFGIGLPRRAVNQSAVGRSAGRRLQRGDLLFFASDSRRSLVTHVGIYEGGNVMVNASQRHGQVRRDDLTERFWATRFMFARRVIDDGTRRAERAPRPEPPRTERNDDRRRDIVRAAAELLLRRFPR
jgi:cell wall-associated NlpC family hydrolase